MSHLCKKVETGLTWALVRSWVTWSSWASSSLLKRSITAFECVVRKKVHFSLMAFSRRKRKSRRWVAGCKLFSNSSKQKKNRDSSLGDLPCLLLVSGTRYRLIKTSRTVFTPLPVCERGTQVPLPSSSHNSHTSPCDWRFGKIRLKLQSGSTMVFSAGTTWSSTRSCKYGSWQ